MIDSLAGYRSPSMISDTELGESLNTFIAQTLNALSTPGSNAPAFFADPDIAVSGSALGEHFMGIEAAQRGIALVAASDIQWEPRLVVSWMRGDIAWAQIRIDGHTVEDGTSVGVPYEVTGIFHRDEDRWTWLYWGGGEPQENSRL
ncbi:nuclear transport factor 2 family protein [Streptomyces parvulus]|uniref:nuclear transport factor 2 family protein n=1 Tax=Streptomyces parvulus TaxID=146923 RepID=UPI00331F63A6